MQGFDEPGARSTGVLDYEAPWHEGGIVMMTAKEDGAWLLGEFVRGKLVRRMRSLPPRWTHGPRI